MKGVKAPDYIRKFIYKKIDDHFQIKFYSEIMGESPIGARLGGKDGLPIYERNTKDEADAISLCQKWNEWYKSTRISSKKKKR